ncbi:hypothetical protein MASR2M78_28180 [Treponema sp.]
MSFLKDKPMWAFWVAYSVLSGILFGIFYAAMYFMVLRWWVPVVAILAVGIVWGSFAYVRDSRERVEVKEEVKPKAKK